MIGCRPVEMWWWQGKMCGQGQEDLENVKDDMKVLGLQPEWAIIIIIYFENVYFFHTKLGLDV